jgi:C6 transcription factor Pro1
MKSYDGCWTCRLRKKRCDERRPLCRNCSTLQVTCHFDDEKPLWMDGGARQKEKAEEVKYAVRDAAARRRGTLPIDVQEPMTTAPNNDAGLDARGLSQQGATTERPLFLFELTPESSPGRPSERTRSDVEPVSTSNNTPFFWNGLDRLPSSTSAGGRPGDSELDRRLMMFYFDHFFPFLFPFYNPPLLEGGRSWVMELVIGNQAMWHTTLCLSVYFVSVALDGSIPGSICKTLAWDKLLKQTSVAFLMLQRDIQDIASRNTQDLLIATARTMGSVIQLQRFEIAAGNFENCQRHLGAAITIFMEIFRTTENVVDNNGQLPRFDSILNAMGRPLWATSQQTGAWNSDQAAFRFYSALLIVDDIIASTCMKETPRLLAYHARLLTSSGSGNPDDEKPPLNIDDVVGCENWVMLQIAAIAALDVWKKSMRKAGQLDVMELVARASVIKQALLGNIARLDAVANPPMTNSPLDLFTRYNDQLPPIPGGRTAFITRGWAQAALLYLSVVVSGWQPMSAGIRENVVRTLAVLERMPAPELLRTMVWPFCIVGCLAAPGEEGRLRAMADALVPQQLFSAVRKALEIMENVWKLRDELAVDTDFAMCVRSVGYVTLLV